LLAVVLCGIFGAAWWLSQSKNRTLRGSFAASSDGKTYLSIDDDNGGSCTPFFVDGAIWTPKVGEAGPIAPGPHHISCGENVAENAIAFEVPDKTIFNFDYWGP